MLTLKKKVAFFSCSAERSEACPPQMADYLFKGVQGGQILVADYLFKESKRMFRVNG